MEGSRRGRDPADRLLGTDENSARPGRACGQWGCLSPLSLLAGELPQTGNQAWPSYFEVSSRLRFWWRDNKWMKGLFSWGCEQLVPDEWALATQGSLWGPFTRGREEQSRPFGWCLPPAPALETITEGKGAKGKRDGRKSSSQTGWLTWRPGLPLLRHLKGLRTVEGVVLENKADSGRISLFPGWEPFILPYLWIKGCSPPNGVTKQSLRCPSLGSTSETLFWGPSALVPPVYCWGNSPLFSSALTRESKCLQVWFSIFPKIHPFPGRYLITIK